MPGTSPSVSDQPATRRRRRYVIPDAPRRSPDRKAPHRRRRRPGHYPG